MPGTGWIQKIRLKWVSGARSAGWHWAQWRDHVVSVTWPRGAEERWPKQQQEQQRSRSPAGVAQLWCCENRKRSFILLYYRLFWGWAINESCVLIYKRWTSWLRRNKKTQQVTLILCHINFKLHLYVFCKVFKVCVIVHSCFLLSLNEFQRCVLLSHHGPLLLCLLCHPVV